VPKLNTTQSLEPELVQRFCGDAKCKPTAKDRRKKKVNYCGHRKKIFYDARKEL